MTVVSAAQDYARATRLGIRVSHATIEHYVRRTALPSDLATVIETVGWEPLSKADTDDKATRLGDLRDEYALLFEALIWARMYGFSESPDFPELMIKDAFYGVNPVVQTYWRRRFQSAAEWYLATERGARIFVDTNNSFRLRRYFAALSREMSTQIRQHNFAPEAFAPLKPQSKK
jgi:hypothetical protein